MSTNNWYERQRSGIEACCRQLVAEKVIEPLSTDEEDTRRWNLYELASLVEGHLHMQLDVSQLSEDARLAFERLVSFDGRPLASPHNKYYLPFWLLDDGRRVGTISLATMYSGIDLITVSSLYIDPAVRRRNLARRALEAVFGAAIANGAGGIRLDTSWTWQPAVRFYARIGMWVWMWKHNLVLTQCCSHNDLDPNLSPARSGSVGATTGGKLADLSLDGSGIVAASAGADSALQDFGEHGLVDLGTGLRGE